MIKKYTLLYLLLAGFVASGCGRFGNKEHKTDSNDRIVSAAKQYTEIMYELGVGSKLVAVDLSSTYPPAAQKLPNIGYHMHLSFEGIMAEKPTLFLHRGGKNFDIGPETVVRQLKKLDVPMKTFDNKTTDIASTKKLIQEMGAYFDRKKQADSLCAKLDADMEKALEKRKQYKKPVKVIVIHFGRAMNIYMAERAESTAGQMVRWAGGTIPGGKNNMGRITSPEMIAKANPDVILLTGTAYDRLGSMEQIKELPGVPLTNAAKNNRIYRISGHDIIYLGPRTGENVLKIQQLIHQKAS